ncbi:polyprenyl diphosphate synthase [Neomegalonema sp.]|uniref:polyprenyl diphosphate synthase n=1 Tax=Neomegalonema sp. TaxID=2039713 RepID=UPI002627E088|nr:polyprenyl diphosphate synthase [Neomegalonema sp.]MDD2869867.1 polyprenyl diphosphate synthase [Neomegalonema sp.]
MLKLRPQTPSATGEGAPSAPPRHVAIIMDGNGRWAKARGLPRLAGHKRGVDSVREVVRAAAEAGVGRLTLYAFSTENWRRPEEEVAGLMDLLRYYLRHEARKLGRDGIRLKFIGDRGGLAADLQMAMASAESADCEGERMVLQIALNYGGRAEILAATRRLALRVAEGELCAENIDEREFAAALTTRGDPDPDLVIRTSGERRISNFLLWQAAYAEYIFTPVLWPDFGREAFFAALEEYGARERRYGGV